MNTSNTFPFSSDSGNVRSPRIAQLTRGVLNVLYGVYAWMAFLMVALPAYLIIPLTKPLGARRRIARRAARLLFQCIGVRLTISGLDKLPEEPHILVVNHTSFLDAIALTALLPAAPGYAFTARQQFRRQRLLCPLLRALGLIVLRNSDARHLSSNIDRIVKALRRGEKVVMFPEGGFTPIAGLGHFHAGAFVAAAKAEVPIVVGALRGTRTALRPRSWMPLRSPIAVEIGAVLHASGTDRASIAALRDNARRLMLPMTGEPDLPA
jgi:1-acyl-sn-glycerol-3-phosphate acyltransferase